MLLEAVTSYKGDGCYEIFLGDIITLMMETSGKQEFVQKLEAAVPKSQNKVLDDFATN